MFKKAMDHIFRGLLAVSICFVACYAFAGDNAVNPQDFFAQVMEAIKSFGGLSFMLKIAAIVTLIVSSMKVSFLNKMVWSKLGSAQTWLAPILGLIAGLLSLGAGGHAITLAAIFAYVSAGSGAIVLHELLDSLKSIPGIGAGFVAIISMIESVLGGPASQSDIIK